MQGRLARTLLFQRVKMTSKIAGPLTRGLFGLVVAAALAALALGTVSCGGKGKPAVRQCIRNSDCAAPLVCGQGYCVSACVMSRDCPGAQNCILLPDLGSVCQALEKKTCAYNSDCDPLRCGVDLQCRNQCVSELDCPSGQKCTTTSKLCVDPIKDASRYNAATNELIPAPGSGGAGGGAGGIAGSGGVGGLGGAAGSAGGLGGAAGGAGGLGGAGGAAGGAGAGGAAGSAGAGGAAGRGGAGGGGGAMLPPSCNRPGNRALHYGGGQYLTIPDAPTLHPADFTAEFWVAFATPLAWRQWQGILTKPHGTSGASFQVYYADGALRAGVAVVQAADYLQTAFAPVLGRWYHVAFSYDHATSSQKLYIDGDLRVSGNAVGALVYDAHPIYVGTGATSNNQAASNPFGGDIDELSIWPSVRTSEQIKADLTVCQPTSTSVADRAGYWPFDDATGQIVTDSGPNANHGYPGSTTNVDAADPTSIFSTVPFGGDFTLPAGGVSPSSACGKPRNKALHFDEGQFAESMDKPTLRPADFTFEAWVRFDTTIYDYGANGGCSHNVADTIAIKGMPNLPPSFAIRYIDEGHPCSSSEPSGTLNAVGTTGRASTVWRPVYGRWYHIAVSYEQSSATNLKLYIDDNLVASAPGTVTHDASPLRLGGTVASNSAIQTASLQGDMDEVMFWSSARTLEQIVADMHTCTPASLTGLAAYWSFDEGTGQTATDATTNRNNLQFGSTVNADANDPSWVVSTVPF